MQEVWVLYVKIFSHNLLRFVVIYPRNLVVRFNTPDGKSLACKTRNCTMVLLRVITALWLAKEEVKLQRGVVLVVKMLMHVKGCYDVVV